MPIGSSKFIGFASLEFIGATRVSSLTFFICASITVGATNPDEVFKLKFMLG